MINMRLTIRSGFTPWRLMSFLLLFCSFCSFSTGTLKPFEKAKKIAADIKADPDNTAGILSDEVANIATKIKEIDALYETVKNNGTLQTILNGKQVEFPVKIPSPVGDENLAIILEGISLDKDGGTVQMSMRFKAGETYLYFYGSDIAFTRNGGFTGETTISLVAPVNIPIGGKKEGEDAKVTITAVADPSRRTKVSFDCDGFRELQLNADITFSRDVIVPVLPNGKVHATNHVEANIETIVTAWDEWIVEASIGRFQAASSPGFVMQVDNFVIDNSQVQNSPNMEFPEGYNPASGTSPMWQGAYFKYVYCELPESMQNASKDKPRNIEARNLIIDDQGITGLFTGNHLIMPDEGKLGDWDFYLYQVQIQLDRNELVAGSLSGAVSLPVSKTDIAEYDKVHDAETGKDVPKDSLTPIPLGGAIVISGTVSSSQSGSGLDYSISAVIDKKINFNSLKMAQVTLLEGSRLDVEIIDGQFKAEALLNGTATLAANSGGKEANEEETPGVEVPGSGNTGEGDKKKDLSLTMEFSRLVFRTHDKPRIELQGDFKLVDNDNGFGKFPITLNSLALRQNVEKEELGIEFDISLSFMDDNAGFGGRTNMAIWTAKSPETKKYKFDRLEVNMIQIDVVQGGFELHGGIRFFRGADDAYGRVYGKGFSGCLDAKFTPGIELTVSGMFGRKSENGEEFKYWYASVNVGLPTPITIFPGMGLNSFKGGASYHLRRVTDAELLTNDDYAEIAAGAFGCEQAVYVPDSKTGLGIVAGVGFQSIPTIDTYNGKIQFTIIFNKSFAPSYIAFEGEVNVVYNPSRTDPPAVKADWKVEWDITGGILSGNFDIYLNVAGGKVVGIHPPNGKAGRVAFYISKNKWYFYLGEPNTPIGVNIAGVFEASAYMVCGSVLPTPPIMPLPSDIILPKTIDYAALNTGAGLAFGTRVSAALRAGAEFEALKQKVYGRIDASIEVGFDVLLNKASEPIYCRENPGEARGINDWYATGQAYIKGGVIIEVGSEGIFDFNLKLAEIGIKAAIFAQLPNPTYFAGVIDAFIIIPIGRGFEKSVSFQGEIGDFCERIGDKSVTLKLIQSTSPGYKAPIEAMDDDPGLPEIIQTINVFDKPSIELVFNHGFEIEFASEDADAVGPVVFEVDANAASFKLECEDCLVEQGDDRYYQEDGRWYVSGSTEIKGKMVVFTPSQTLEGLKRYKFRYTAIAEPTDLDYLLVEDEVEVAFLTHQAPPQISNLNVAYSYPLPGMQNLYPNESDRGYLKTLVHQPVSYIIPEGKVWEIRYMKGEEFVYTSRSVKVVGEKDAEYNFEFPIPDNLELGTNYNFQIVQTAMASLPEEPEFEAGESQQGIPRKSSLASDVIIVDFAFKTSNFRTFADKFANYVHRNAVEEQGVIMLSFDGSGIQEEEFSNIEFRGYITQGVRTSPLVQLESSEINHEIASLYNNLRDQLTSKIGESSAPSLQDAVNMSRVNGDVTINFEIPNVFQTLIQKIDDYNKLAKLNQNESTIFVPSSLPKFDAGNYAYQAAYYLPGKTEPSSVANIGFNVSQDIPLRVN